jgi:hypothetical protein
VVICIKISSSEVFDPKGSSPYTELSYMRHKYTVQRPDLFGAKTSIPDVSIRITTEQWHINEFYLTIFQHHMFIFIAAII